MLECHITDSTQFPQPVLHTTCLVQHIVVLQDKATETSGGVVHMYANGDAKARSPSRHKKVNIKRVVALTFAVIVNNGDFYMKVF